MTEAEKQEILNAIKAESQSVDELESVETLDNVNSLPAMNGTKVVKVPISLLSKPAIDAASAANSAAKNAEEKAKQASEDATKASNAASEATAATSKAVEAVKSVENVLRDVEGTVSASVNGQTARFDYYITDANVQTLSATDITAVAYISGKRLFAGVMTDGTYANDWSTADMYMDSSRKNVLKDKIYLCDDKSYIWSEEKMNLIEMSGHGSGSGSGFYNLTIEQPLPSGYYHKETAIAALANADIEDKQQGMIITFEASAGKWEDYRFVGSSLSTFMEVSAWELFGGGDAIKKLHVTKGTKTEDLIPDDNGVLNLDIPIVETDQTIEENSTNPVSGKAVHAKFNEVAGKYGAALKLNETGDGNAKAFSLSLLDERGEVLSTSDQFTGGGGGSVATTKLTLTRLTANPTVKNGDAVKLSYKYDQIDSASGESTGNSGKAVVTITHGANSTSIESTIAAGSTQDINVSSYIGTGTNTVRVKVTAGEGNEAQVSSISWTVTVVQLTLTSSFNIATVINRGDTVSIPYALSGSGTKTLRCYIDGTDSEDRTITASSANGSFSINTYSMNHGSHTIQMVAELELPGGSTIKSNSIYYAIGIRENGNKAPIVCTRFDYSDGAIITGGNAPYIDVKQYDNYTLKYAVYNPTETPTTVNVYEAGSLLSSAKLAFTTTQLLQRAMNYGSETCQIQCGTTTYTFMMIVSASELNVSEPTDNLVLKLSANGRSNDDTNKTEWSYNGIQTTFEGFKWGGDGWLDNALRHTDDAHTTISYQPLKQPEQNVNNAMSFVVKFKVSEVAKDDAELIKCVDANGTGFVITPNEARMVTKGNSKLSMKMAAGETYEVGFVSFPKAANGASDYEITNSEMVYLYINGIMSGCVQRGTSDSIYQATPQNIEMGAPGATLDVYLLRSYSTYLTDAQMLDCYIIDQDGVSDLMKLYEENNVLDENGNLSVDSVPHDMRYIIITGKQANGVATVMQAAVTNNKKTKFDVDEVLCIKRSEPSLNFHLIGGCISLQGTSSLAYPIKNYRLYTYSSNKTPGTLYVGCNSQGEGGTLVDDGAYSFRLADGTRRKAAPVKCFCLKADYAESSSSHNTGMARLAQDTLVAADELTPAQQHVDTTRYDCDVRTTIDGEPCLLFYRGSVEETPVLLGKFNFNNDKSTEAVFGFLDIPGYHDADWVNTKFGGNNPTQCWEFLNNDYPMGMFLDDDFTSCDADGTPNWQKVFEGRFPDGGTDTTYLKPLVSWLKSTNRKEAGINDTEKTSRATKFKTELNNYFDVDYLCDYYALTEIFGCVDQRVKNMMMAFFYNPDKEKMLAYMIFYDCDTILGVRNDGRLKYSWDVNEDTIDTELSTSTKTVYAYAGHDSVLWANLRELFADKIGEAYKRLRAKMSNDTVFQMFDKEQSAKYCAKIYNVDAMNKYVTPKTKGVEVTVDGSVTNVKYSYLEAMQGSRQAHRHWWLTNRFGLLDARYSTGQYTQTDISWKGNSAIGAKVKATAKREFYFEFRREGETMVHSSVKEGEVFSYTYNQVANVGTIFHLLGGQWMSALDLSGWGGFTDVNLPQLPILEELTMGKVGNTYTLTELVLGTKLPMLKRLDLTNYTKLPSLDLSGCTRLEEVYAGGCSSLATMSFAPGAPLSKLVLPDNYQTLVLRSLPKLTRMSITLNGSNIKGLWVENCAQLDGFELFSELFALGGLKYVRLTGIDMEGDGSDLKQWYEAGLGGIDADGNIVGKCKLCGNYKLTTYLSDDEYDKYVELFDELKIEQSPYTIIEYDNSVQDDANVSNYDNKTGYKFGNSYVPSGHLAKLFSLRHRVLGKQATKGVMTICQLHDEDSSCYADSDVLATASNAKLDGVEGDVFIREPHYWFKGINDFLNNKNYSCYCVGDMPKKPDASIVSYDEILSAGNVKKSYKIVSGKNNLLDSYVSDGNYSVCRVNVSGYKRVRFPTVPGTGLIASVFTANDGSILDTKMANSLIGKFEPGMYLIADVPSDAIWINFTIQNTAEFDEVVLSNSTRIEDMEPDWVEHEECLVGVFETTIVDGKPRSVVSGGSSSSNMSWTEFNYYSSARGMQQIDYDMHRDIANLFYAKYGRRDCQSQCGAGQHTQYRLTGGTVTKGMTDTIGYDEAYSINPNITKALVDNINPQYAWYKETDYYGVKTVRQVNNTCCLGYEDIYGDKWEMMDKVNVNVDSSNYKWLITMPDGTQRRVKGSSMNNMWITGVVHGKYMDIIPAGNVSGSNSTNYCDMFYVSGSLSRVVYRGYGDASSYGGVSCASAYDDASYASSSIGSRLAFRGKIVWAASVSAYKSIIEVA